MLSFPAWIIAAGMEAFILVIPKRVRSKLNIGITNYVNLVAEAIGIHREDKFKTYAHWGDLDRILNDADQNILESSFGKERILEVLKTVFVK